MCVTVHAQRTFTFCMHICYTGRNWPIKGDKLSLTLFIGNHYLDIALPLIAVVNTEHKITKYLSPRDTWSIDSCCKWHGLFIWWRKYIIVSSCSVKGMYFVSLLCITACSHNACLEPFIETGVFTVVCLSRWKTTLFKLRWYPVTASGCLKVILSDFSTHMKSEPTAQQMTPR